MTIKSHYKRGRGTKDSGPLPALIGGTLVVAALATVMVKDGWLIWIPVLLALAVVGKVWDSLGR